MTFLAPVVEPGPALNPSRLARYSRQLALPGFDETAQRRLAAARVIVVGAGGLGSATIPYLAAAGIGTIGVVDTDIVELSNLHRQTAHGMADLGTEKVDSIAKTVSQLDPETTVNRHRMRIDSSNALELFAEYDLVLDGSDNFATRYLVNDAAALSHKPLVWGAILRYGGQVSVAFADHGPHYRDLFPAPPAAEDVMSCELGGVLPTVCAVIGSVMSSEAIKLITGIGEPLIGRVMSYDALSARFREISYRAQPDAAPITALIDYAAFCGVAERAEDTGDAAEQQLRASLSSLELSRSLAAHESLQLIDVREPFEAKIASIAGAELIPLGALESSLERISRELPIVIYCHHDSRSQHAATVLRRLGITNVRWLEGGIDAFARTADRSLARY